MAILGIAKHALFCPCFSIAAREIFMKAKSCSANGCGENCSLRFSRMPYGFPDKENRAKALELLGSIYISLLLGTPTV
jgi:hypothetical protein